MLDQPVYAASINVTNTNDSGEGSLRQAIFNAQSGDTITISTTGTITLQSQLPAINKDLTIQGPRAGSLTMSGNNQSRVFRVDSGTVSINDLTVADGKAIGNNQSGLVCQVILPEAEAAVAVGEAAAYCLWAEL